MTTALVDRRNRRRRFRGRPGGRPAAFFDLDKTIIAKSSALAFSKPFYAGGLINRRRCCAAPTPSSSSSSAARTTTRWRRCASSSRRWSPAGTSTRCARSSPTRCTTSSTRSSTTRRSRLIEEHHARRPRRHHRLGVGRGDGRADRRAARRRRRDRQPAGDRGRPLHRRHRLLRVRREQGGGDPELAERRGYDLARSYAYSDSITDVHMLEAVGHPHAVNPDKELRRVARERGWPVLVFNRPVALAARMRLPRSAARWRRSPPVRRSCRWRDLPRGPTAASAAGRASADLTRPTRGTSTPP